MKTKSVWVCAVMLGGGALLVTGCVYREPAHRDEKRVGVHWAGGFSIFPQ